VKECTDSTPKLTLWFLFWRVKMQTRKMFTATKMCFQQRKSRETESNR